MNKKYSFVALALAAILAFSGCSEEGEKSSKKTEPSTSSSPSSSLSEGPVGTEESQDSDPYDGVNSVEEEDFENMDVPEIKYDTATPRGKAAQEYMDWGLGNPNATPEESDQALNQILKKHGITFEEYLSE